MVNAVYQFSSTPVSPRELSASWRERLHTRVNRSVGASNGFFKYFLALPAHEPNETTVIYELLLYIRSSIIRARLYGEKSTVCAMEEIDWPFSNLHTNV